MVRKKLLLCVLALLLAACAPAVQTVQVEVTRQVVQTLPVERVVVQTVEVTRVVPQTVIVTATRLPPRPAATVTPASTVTPAASVTPAATLTPAPTLTRAAAAFPSASPTLRPLSSPAASRLAPLPPDPNPPLALAWLEGQVLRFECLDRKTCLPEFDLAGKTVMTGPYVLGRAYYWNPQSLYVTLRSKSVAPAKMDILHINPQTGEIRAMPAPYEPDYTIARMVAGQLALARFGGRAITLIDRELSAAPVDVRIKIDRLSVEGNRLIAFSETPVQREDGLLLDLAVIDLPEPHASTVSLALEGLGRHASGQPVVADRTYLQFVEGVSGDLQQVYGAFLRGSDPAAIRLGTFEPGSTQPLTVTPPVNLGWGFGQSHDLLYRGYSGSRDGGGPGAGAYNLTSGRSLLDFAAHPEWAGQKLLVMPFGENLLLGRSDELILLSPDGEILASYPLPAAWVDQDYNIVSFQK